MPLYEYECDNGHRFEKIVKFSDPPLDKCPTCGAPVHKLMSSPAIQFKGSGWYITDYAKKDQGGASAKTADGGTAATKDQSAKTDGAAKPDAAAKGPSSTESASLFKAPATTEKK